ncbi:MAG: hypothetical protein CMF27_00760 [Kiritimatiellaceae bacterium]|jgi:nicotinamide-nucleotide amidase|nr:hypothetical protein [Kiritimatiellaceae bacterium]
MKPNAELISIGNELLSGRTLNTHGRDLGAALFSIGIDLVRDTSIGDHIDLIKSVAQEALQRTPILFISGGLGPTVDDITRDALAALFNRAIHPHPPTADYLKEWYQKRGRKLNSIGLRQALVLEEATVLPNPIGAAPAQRIDLPQNKRCYLLPGPPNEFNAIIEKSILPELKSQYAHLTPKLVRSIHTRGIGESDIVEQIQLQNISMPEGIDPGFYPAQGRVEIRLTAEAHLENELDQHHTHLLKLFSDWLDRPKERAD